MSNEVFVGANAQVGLCPEMDMYFDNKTISGSQVFTATAGSDYKLVSGLYVGCMAKVVNSGTTTYHAVLANDETTITLDTDAPAASGCNITILGFGAPVAGPVKTGSTVVGGILSDSWLGLVNTFTPPNVEVEMKQLNLAAAGGRNFDYQYKGSETVSGGSLDLSLNNGSWLYYTLGEMTFTSAQSDVAATSSNTHNGILTREASEDIVRGIEGNTYPDVDDGAGNARTLNAFNLLDTASPFVYTFTEADSDVLPSFALDVVYGKRGRTGSTQLDSNNPNTNMYSRIFTGCQVNTMTLTFEEGQELKTTLDLVSRRAFDTPNGYIPMRGQSILKAITNDSSDVGNDGSEYADSGFVNYSTNAKPYSGSSLADNYPFLFSDGAIKLFGQVVGKVKTGSVTINNNLTPQRFIGNYNRQIASAHLPGQRTYEISLTMLISDTKLWDQLRIDSESGEEGTSGELSLTFEKDTGEKIFLKFEDYLINSVTVPFPEDKGPIDVEVQANARTLSSATYTGKWAIYSVGGRASSE
jgi:hypothetical protein|tara:strand:- start:118 stop:1698 length:1581 start_codon:yes stop_codon:yes gene_type:complete